MEGLVTKKKKKRNRRVHSKTSSELEQLIINLAEEYILDGVETLSDRLQYENNITLHLATIYRILKRNNIRYTDYQPYTRKRWGKTIIFS